MLAPVGSKQVEVPSPPAANGRTGGWRRWPLYVLLSAVAGGVAFFDDSLNVAERFGWVTSEAAPMTAETRQRLVQDLREALRDGEVSLEEQAGIEDVAQRLAVGAAALNDLQEQVQPSLREANLRLEAGMDLVRRQSYEAARSEFLAATLHDPGDPIAWTNLAEANRLTGRSRNAMEASARAVAEAPSNWVVQYNHGLLLAQLEQPELALDHLEKAVLLVDEPNRDGLRRDLETNPVLAELRRQGRMAELGTPGDSG